MDGFFPAILAQEEWDELQERISIRRESSRGKTHASEMDELRTTIANGTATAIVPSEGLWSG